MKKIIAWIILITLIVGVPFYDAVVCCHLSIWWGIVAIPVAMLASAIGAFIGIWIGKILF